MAATLGFVNPFRYRGYVYDEETGLYYLRSRYYNPEWNRFVNADAVLGVVSILLSQNIFSYCNNSPIVNSDPSGEILKAIIN
ncbi:MAG: RHS repeat-associated core domain-containing protein [Eubacteriales bacterium]|nr:RHS repeat-associated core domain-containing protein [Eubacteriales bacterium]